MINKINYILIPFFAIAALIINPSNAQGNAIKQGVDYEILKTPLAPDSKGSPDKVDVQEFFSLVCIHCYNFENTLANWVSKNSRKINFTRTQFVLPGSGLGAPILGEVYYTLEAMGVADGLMIPAYKAMLEERISFSDDKALTNWLTRNKVDLKKFAETRKSFGVNAAVGAAQRRVAESEVQSTPQLVIGGKYRIIANSSFEQVLQVADALITKVEFEKKSSKK